MTEIPTNYLDPRVLDKVARLELRARLVVEGFVTGMHKSPYRGFSVPVSLSTLYRAAPTPLSPRYSTMSSYPTRCHTTQTRLNQLRSSTWENAGHARRCEGVPEPHSTLG